MGRTKFKTYQKIKASILYKPLKRFCLNFFPSPRFKPWAIKSNEMRTMDLSISFVNKIKIYILFKAIGINF